MLTPGAPLAACLRGIWAALRVVQGNAKSQQADFGAVSDKKVSQLSFGEVKPAIQIDFLNTAKLVRRFFGQFNSHMNSKRGLQSAE